MNDITLKGSALIEIIEESTGEVVETREQENIILNSVYLAIPPTSAVTSAQWNNSFASSSIYISSTSSVPNRTGPSIFMIAIGWVPGGTTSPQVFTGGTYPIYQCINQFAATGSTRTFSSVGMTTAGGNNNVNANTTNYQTYLVLDDAPCTQGPTQIVQITYQIQFLYDLVNGLKWKASSYAARLGLTSGTQGIADVMAYYGNCQFANEYTYLHTTHNADENQFAYQGVPATTVTYTRQDAGFFVTYYYFVAYNNNARDGFILNGLLYSRISTPAPDSIACMLGSGRFTENTGEPFQVGFLHNTESPLTPFYSLAAEGTGTGIYNFSGTWTHDLPFLLRIQIVAGGAVGTATYRFAVMYHVGFRSNIAAAWTQKVLGVPWFNGRYQPHPRMYGWATTADFVPKLFSRQRMEIIYFAANGVSLINLSTGQCRKWDSVESMNATNITQVTVAGAVGSEKIFAACRNTGVWEIDPYANTVVQRVSGVACYGIATGFSDEVFALCEGSLRSSANWTTGLTISFTGLTNSNWARCRYLKGDTVNSQNQIAIVIETTVGGSTHQIVWWNKNNTTAVGGPTSSSNSILVESAVHVTSTSRWIYQDGTGSRTVAFNGTTGTIPSPSRHRIVDLVNRAAIVPVGDKYYATSTGIIDPDTNTVIQTTTITKTL